MDFTLKIWRQKDSKSKGGFKSYEIKNISEDASFLEMLDILNEQLVMNDEMPVNFDSDCREGICGSCSLYVNGRPHGPDTGITICQVHMRKFKGLKTIEIGRASCRERVCVGV